MQEFGTIVSELVMIAATIAGFIYWWSRKEKSYLLLWAFAFFLRSVWGGLALIEMIQPAFAFLPMWKYALLPIAISLLFFIGLIMAVHAEDPKVQLARIERELKKYAGNATDDPARKET